MYHSMAVKWCRLVIFYLREDNTLPFIYIDINASILAADHLAKQGACASAGSMLSHTKPRWIKKSCPL